jgi:hypothetical protein
MKQLLQNMANGETKVADSQSAPWRRPVAGPYYGHVGFRRHRAHADRIQQGNLADKMPRTNAGLFGSEGGLDGTKRAH